MPSWKRGSSVISINQTGVGQAGSAPRAEPAPRTLPLEKGRINPLKTMRFIFSFVFFIVLPAQAYVSIDVGQAHVRESQVALQPLILRGPVSPSTVKAGALILNTLSHNFSTSAYFRLIDTEAFLEKPGEKGLEPYPKEPNGFIWKNWQILNTDYLILGEYSIVAQKLVLNLYLYHVPLRRKVFQKKYSTHIKQAEKQAEKLAHKMSNDIISALTNRPGIFLTKITAVRSMRGNKKELFIMDWNGKNKQQVSFHRSSVLSPAWSPDGKHIAYTSFLYQKSKKKRIGALLLYNRLNKSRRIISKGRGARLGSDFLPGGNHILLSVFLRSGNMDIAKMSLKNGFISPITSGPNGAINVEPTVHPNGKRLVFSSDRGGKIMLYSLSLKDGRTRPLTYRGSYNSTPDYSPDGKQVVFSGYANGRFDIFIMNEDGSGLKRLTSFQTDQGKWANNESPSFSPDGRYIVFTSNRNGFYQLYIMNLSTLQLRRITHDSHNYKSPKWSPLLP